MTPTPRAIRFNEETVETVAQESDLRLKVLEDMLVDDITDDVYYFVLDMPTDDGVLPWAIVSDFTLHENFKFVGIESDTTFNRIIRKS